MSDTGKEQFTANQSIYQLSDKDRQGFFQPFWEGVALGNFRHFNRNWEIFFIHFSSIFLSRDA